MLLFCLLIFSLFHLGNSECCYWFLNRNGDEQCADCTEPTFCCGYGPCNFFCCNCDNGCRQGTCHPYDPPWYYKNPGNSTAQLIFNYIDKNGDYKLSFNEVNDHYGDLHDIKKEFSLLDTNKDGFITINEMDSDEA